MKTLQMTWWLLRKAWIIYSATAHVYFPLPSGAERAAAKRDMWKFVRSLARVELGL